MRCYWTIYHTSSISMTTVDSVYEFSACLLISFVFIIYKYTVEYNWTNFKVFQYKKKSLALYCLHLKNTICKSIILSHAIDLFVFIKPITLMEALYCKNSISFPRGASLYVRGCDLVNVERWSGFRFISSLDLCLIT